MIVDSHELFASLLAKNIQPAPEKGMRTMRLLATVFTAKGFFGEAISLDSKATLMTTLTKMVEKIADLPDEIEGERSIDWTKITIEIERK